MIQANELRLGNYVLHKANHKIVRVAMDYSHFELLAKGEGALFFPVVLKAELFEQCGFLENKDYPLAPQAREFKLILPLPGSHQVEIAGYIKSNSEAFARAVVDNLTLSKNVYHLHQLQNLYFTLSGKELEINS